MAVLIQADGKIVLGGQFSELAGRPCSNLGRLLNTDAAISDLAWDGTQLVWLRGGSSPEVWRTTFEYSTNLAQWVNLGAGTSNSDLKNTYGTVKIQHQGRRIDTKMQFFGCVIGDYSKSAINTSIFTGKIIGVNSMLYGYVGQNVASFTNYAASFGQVTECSLDQAVSTQRRMFARRKRRQTPEDIELLRSVFELTSSERRISSEAPVL